MGELALAIVESGASAGEIECGAGKMCTNQTGNEACGGVRAA